MRRGWRAGVALAAASVLIGAAPAGRAVMARCGDVTLTEAGARQLLASLPAGVRDKVRHDQKALVALLQSSLLQDFLYAEAHKAGFDRRPDVRAAAERAREGAIADAYAASEVGAPPEPSDAQLQALYAANEARLMQPRAFHLAQIFLAVPKGTGDAAVAAAKARLAALRPGLTGKPKEFAAVARRLSDDKHSAPEGGDLGWLAETQLREPVRDAVAGLAVGAISDPVRTDDGWHLIELLGTRKAAPLAFAQARGILAQAFREQAARQQTTAYLNGVLKAHPVTIDMKAVEALTGAKK